MQPFSPFLEREKEEDGKEKRKYEMLTSLSTAFPSLSPIQRAWSCLFSIHWCSEKGRVNVILEDSTEKINKNKRKTVHPKGPGERKDMWHTGK